MTSLAFTGENDLEQPKRQYIRATDSDYVRLSKQGGQKDLLEHHANEEAKEATPYKSNCDWYKYDAAVAEESQQQPRAKKNEPKPVVKDNGESAIDIRKKLQKKYQTTEAPFHTDTLSHWDRQIQEAKDVHQNDHPGKREKIRSYPF